MEVTLINWSDVKSFKTDENGVASVVIKRKYGSKFQRPVFKMNKIKASGDE